ncbi:phosphatase PAP2 family protein [Jejuia spongiicola]|uniref:Phosphatase PAP2 family protein n=1 Tax=Jejuia spongiicola TaxID=2942207 RepID=A0ABT0QDK0_9FLAO|nr:phosphatase PAP2 family protein [Jejuia spongiicola]MCL6294070.1 phosphatase PAP2 family protein [Jejuia spongiicola]
MQNIKLYLFIFLLLFSFKAIRAQDDSPSELRFEKDIQDAGDVIQLALPATAFLGTLIKGDKKGSWQFVKAFSTNLAVTYALKYAINKPRPDGATDGHAFPSGHTSVAFQSAAFIQRRYGWEYGIPAYALAGFVAYSRTEGFNDRHDAWDVLGGIVVGIGSTYLFTSEYQKERFQLSFSSENNSYQVGLTFKF